MIVSKLREALTLSSTTCQRDRPLALHGSQHPRTARRRDRSSSLTTGRDFELLDSRRPLPGGEINGIKPVPAPVVPTWC